ncbi:cell division protein CrgA [Alloscardovia criceti]|uniref:cell division protein CrgA n=1 Tax=Alloscardovia criceti TaxID=356828 RepID=UPI00035C49FC|nr:cell division protein CrgA [Alloscardovia criceti]
MAQNEETPETSEELLDNAAEAVATTNPSTLDVQDDVTSESAQDASNQDAAETSEEEAEVAEAEESDEEELSAADLAGIRAAEAMKKTLEHPESLSPRVQAAVKRTEDETRRVEKTVEGTKSNPSWYVPLFSFFLVLGLVWVIVFYLKSGYPIPGLGYWNLAIGFAIMMVGFVLMMSWH